MIILYLIRCFKIISAKERLIKRTFPIKLEMTVRGVFRTPSGGKIIFVHLIDKISHSVRNDIGYVLLSAAYKMLYRQ